MISTSDVLAHHRRCFAARDLDGLMAGYSADAVFFSPEGALRGPEAIRGVFQELFSKLPVSPRYLECAAQLLMTKTAR